MDNFILEKNTIKMKIIYPRLANGNILWTCDNCGNTAGVSYSKTHMVSIYCQCDGRCHPECNTRWYNENWCYEKDEHKKYFEGIMK